MQKVKEQVILAKDDHEIIVGHLKLGLASKTFSRQEAESLEMELKKAKLVNKEVLPDDVVRLNSVVTIKDEMKGKVMELMVVTPEQADIKQRKISVMSPIGTALIGFRKGNKISWKVPSGSATFQILEVRNLLQ